MNTYRLPPCPIFDIEGMETWLEEMASQGYFFKSMRTFASFQKKEPKKVRYRIEPLPKKASLFSGKSVEPIDESIALNESFGWHYVSKYLYFAIYMTEDEHAPELHTDSQVHASALKQVQKKLNREFLIYAILLFILGWTISKLGWMIYLATISNFYLMSSLFVLILGMISYSWNYILIKQLIQKLNFNQRLNHQKNFHRYSYLYYFIEITYSIAFVLFLCLNTSLDIKRENKSNFIPLETYQEEIPFNTLQDLNMNFDSEKESYVGGIQIKHNFLTNAYIQYQEDLVINQKDEDNLKCLLKIEYYDLKIEAMAKKLAKEIYELDARRYIAWGQFKEIPVNNLPPYTIYAYDQFRDIQNIILVKENQVIKLSFYQPGPKKTIPMETWTHILTDKFLN